jgi:S1-C subfamily serine protease
MKHYLALARNIILVIITVLAVIVSLSFLAPKPQPPAINSPAIAEYRQSQYVRKLLTPATFDLKMNVYISKKDMAWERMDKRICASGAGTAFTSKEKGYFLTNNHVTDPNLAETGCLYRLAKKRNVPISSLFGVRFDIEYILTNAEKISFPARVAHTFPKIDLAVLKITERNADIADVLANWKSVDFRTGSPNIIDEKVVSGKGPLIVPDEQVATMGGPLGLPFTVTTGILGSNTFFNLTNIPLVHFIAPINSGNSGGQLISLLDFKAIGMVTMSKADFEGNDRSLQSGAVPFWEIQKALKEVGMK